REAPRGGGGAPRGGPGGEALLAPVAVETALPLQRLELAPSPGRQRARARPPDDRPDRRPAAREPDVGDRAAGDARAGPSASLRVPRRRADALPRPHLDRDRRRPRGARRAGAELPAPAAGRERDQARGGPGDRARADPRRGPRGKGGPGPSSLRRRARRLAGVREDRRDRAAKHPAAPGPALPRGARGGAEEPARRRLRSPDPPPAVSRTRGRSGRDRSPPGPRRHAL